MRRSNPNESHLLTCSKKKYYNINCHFSGFHTIQRRYKNKNNSIFENHKNINVLTVD